MDSTDFLVTKKGKLSDDEMTTTEFPDRKEAKLSYWEKDYNIAFAYFSDIAKYNYEQAVFCYV
jgi:hypothetical protein